MAGTGVVLQEIAISQSWCYRGLIDRTATSHIVMQDEPYCHQLSFNLSSSSAQSQLSSAQLSSSHSLL